MVSGVASSFERQVHLSLTESLFPTSYPSQLLCHDTFYRFTPRSYLLSHGAVLSTTIAITLNPTTTMATNPASATEVGFPYYTRLPPELKGEIWKQSLLSPGVHYFNFDGQRVSELGHGITDHDYAYVTAFAKSTDTSAWRVRNAISEVDEAASKTVKLFEKGTNMKKLFPLQPLRRRPADASVAMVDCDNDLVCFRILGKLVPTWDRPATATRFTGIKRVALEFKAQPVALEWPFPSHTHCCQAWDHELKPLCGQSIGIFLSNFPDLEEFYLIVKLTPWDCGMAPLGWAPMPGTKRTMVSAQLRRFRGTCFPPTIYRSKAQFSVFFIYEHLLTCINLQTSPFSIRMSSRDLKIRSTAITR